MLEELQRAVADVRARVGPAVVGIGGGWGLGTGIVIAEGVVLTNAHNLRTEETPVRLPDGRSVSARVRAADEDGDLAVVAGDTAGVPALAWSGRAESVEVGTPVLALANPGGRGLRVTFGLVAATGRSFRGPRGRRIGGALEHSAPLPRGASGGPVVALDGSLLGLNTHRLGDGLYLAVPADARLRARAEALAGGTAPARRRLGVALASPEASRRLRASVGLPERAGLLVHAVEDGSPAHTAGLRRGDLIAEVDGRAVASGDALFDALDAAGGGALRLRLLRGSEELEVVVPRDEASGGRR